MLRYIISVLFLMVSFMLFGNVNAESFPNTFLSKRLSNGTDSLKALQLHTKGIQYYEIDSLNMAIDLATQSLELNINSNSTDLNAQNYLLLGRIYRKLHQSKLALKYYLNAIGIYEKGSNSNYQAVAIFELGVLFLIDEANEKAIEYFNKSAQILNGINECKILPDDYYLLELTSPIFFDYYKSNTDFKSLCNELLVLVLQRQLKYTEASVVYGKLIATYKLKNNQKLIPLTYNNMAFCFSRSGQYVDALKIYQELYSFYKERYSIAGVAATANNIGIIYFQLKEYENAIKWFTIVLGADKGMGKNESDHAIALINIGVCYQNMGDYQESIGNFKNALDIYSQNADTVEMAKTSYIITTSYFYKDDLYNAELYCIEAIKAAEKAKEFNLLQELYQTYSEILEQGNDPDLALAYYQKYLNVRDSIVLEKRIEEQAKSQKQLDTEKSEKEMKLSLADEEMKDLALKQLKLEAEKSEKEIALLWKEKELKESEVKQKDLERQKAIQELTLLKQQKEAVERDNEISSIRQMNENQELKIKQNELEQQKRIKEMALLKTENDLKQLALEKNDAERRHSRILFAFLTIISIVILGSLILTRRKNKILDKQRNEILVKNVDLSQKNEEIKSQKEFLESANRDINNKNEEITAQNELIGRRNKDITSSINYASRIQRAIIPPDEILANGFNDYFVLFRPRDIVSGDFYWIKQVGERLVIAAADCTGHGVPGALMSMLGVSFLNEIVAYDYITDANQILNELRKRVKTSLRQTGKESDTKDGMDIALCIFNPTDLSLQFAGAYNPLYLIRNNELIEIKADRMPIGIYVREKESFTNNIIQLQKNDAFYIFTDGFCDQFGGERTEKFKIQPYKELLLSVQAQPMCDQKDALSNAYDNWKGTYEQIDDVLVIGMKV